VLEPEDPRAVAEALLRLSRGEGSEHMSLQSRTMARELTWSRCAAPLLEFCRRPSLAPDRAAGYRYQQSPPTSTASANLGLMRKAIASFRVEALPDLQRTCVPI